MGLQLKSIGTMQIPHRTWELCSLPSPGGAATHRPRSVGLQSPVCSCPRPSTEQIPTCPQLSPARCQEQKCFLTGLTRTLLVAGDRARLLQGSERSIQGAPAPCPAPLSTQQHCSRCSLTSCTQGNAANSTQSGSSPHGPAPCSSPSRTGPAPAGWRRAGEGGPQVQESSESQGCCCTEQSRSGSTREVLCLEDRSLATQTTQRSVFYKYAGAPGHAAVAARSGEESPRGGRAHPAAASTPRQHPREPPTTSRARARSRLSTTKPWHGAGPKGTGPRLGRARLRRSAPGLSPATCKPLACPSPGPPLGAPLVGDAALRPSAPPRT